jgi:hypothetical protein
MKIKEVFSSLQHNGMPESEIEKSYLAKFRQWRNDELFASDWTQLADAPVNATAWAHYRQSLRDLPKQQDFANAELPDKP